MQPRAAVKVVAIIQARMGSTRLPGKVLLDLAGKPMLERVVNRVGRARRIDELVVATTTQPGDDRLAEFCGARAWPFFRGSESDVLDRYYHAARKFGAQTVVRITSDCPLIEPEMIDRVVAELEDGASDYACNILPRRTFPRGLDVEAFTFEALERSWREDTNPAWREHVTTYIQRHPELFRIRGVLNEVDYSSHRWTVDTPEDLELVRKIYHHFGHDDFSWHDVLKLLESHPAWSKINRHIEQKKV